MEARTESQQFALLMILQSTCETTLQAFRTADNPLDDEFVADLQRIIARTDQELEALRESRQSSES